MSAISLNESVRLKHPPEWAPGKRALARAIFTQAARPLAESIPSLAQAVQLRSEVERGKQRMADVGLQETVVKNRTVGRIAGEAHLLDEIFTARLNTPSEVLPYNGRWAFFEVVRVTRRFVSSLSQVHGSIKAHLEAARLRDAIAAFAFALRRKWSTRTDCRSGFVVQTCRQFKGMRHPEDPLSLP